MFVCGLFDTVVRLKLVQFALGSEGCLSFCCL